MSPQYAGMPEDRGNVTVLECGCETIRVGNPSGPPAQWPHRYCAVHQPCRWWRHRPDCDRGCGQVKPGLTECESPYHLLDCSGDCQPKPTCDTVEPCTGT